jgi:formyltetrahydrofolate hydrolase
MAYLCRSIIRNANHETSMPTHSYILTFSCPNKPGIVATVARTLFESGGNIQEAHQYDDVETNIFLRAFALISWGRTKLEVSARLLRLSPTTYK